LAHRREGNAGIVIEVVAVALFPVILLVVVLAAAALEPTPDSGLSRQGAGSSRRRVLPDDRR
jgi:hypothetical protein